MGRGESAVVSARAMTYGRCPCSGSYELRSVELRMSVDGEAVVLTDVPQGACPKCGARVYKGGILEIVEVIMRGEAGRHSGAP
jgi:YgiT-type zinc finger domain-containing protein